MKLIDVHCHINSEDYGDVDTLMNNILSSGVCKIISVGFDLPSTLYSMQLAKKYPFVYFTAGFHPTELKNYRAGDIDRIEEIAQDEKCVAIGEIGLDYHYPDTNKELQTQVFVAQLELAKKLNLPVQIHSRDSAEDMYNILKEHAKTLTGGMLHCYSHSPELAEKFEKLGLYFSFGGTCTYSGSKKAKRTISCLPVNKIMTETDSPYLPPKSKYGTFPNTPESIEEIIKCMAEIKGIDVCEFSSQVWENAHTLFKKLN